VLAWLAHGVWVKTDQMIVEGSRALRPADFKNASVLGFGIKLLAVITRDFAKNELRARAPDAAARGNVVANISGVFNAVSVKGDVVGTTFYSGRGAGQDATASAVIGDIADAAALLPLRQGRASQQRSHDRSVQGCRLAPPESIRSRYYLRLTVKDQPGVLARVASVMAKTPREHRERDSKSRRARRAARWSSRPTRATSARWARRSSKLAALASTLDEAGVAENWRF